MTLWATTTPGIEDVALAEGRALLESSGFTVVAAAERFLGVDGLVGWEIDGRHTDCRHTDGRSIEALRSSALCTSSRSIYHLVVHVAELDWRDGAVNVPAYGLDRLVAAVDAVDLPELRRLSVAGRFRVTCRREGNHAFRSPDVERAVGALLNRSYGVAVDLERFDVNVSVDIVGTRAFLGYQLTGRKGRDRRHDWKYHPRVTVRTPIAYALLVLAGYEQRPGALLDPCCGSGTILLEAGGVARDCGYPLPALFASDRDPAAVAGARRNLDAAGLSAVDVTRLDVHELKAHLRPESLDYIVTNPPFGVRLGRRIDYHYFYQSLLAGAAWALRSEGRLVLIVDHHRALFDRVAADFRTLRAVHVRPIAMGSLTPDVIVLERTVASRSS